MAIYYLVQTLLRKKLFSDKVRIRPANHKTNTTMINFEVTRDPDLLEQYYTLREHCYREDLGLRNFDGSEEACDRNGHVLVVHRNGRVIGGARSSSTVPSGERYQELNLNESICCVWERFVLDPIHRSVKLAREFLTHLIHISNLLGYQHALILSSLRNARFYRACHTAVGVPFEIHRSTPEFARDEFAGLEHYLSVAHLREVQRLRLVA